MPDIINLRQVRKAKKRANKAEIASINRTKFGRTKAEKNRDAQKNNRMETDLNGKKLDDAPI